MLQRMTDAAQVKEITKDEMVTFYKKFLDPSSADRARLSVHLHAQGASELKLNDSSQGKRQSADLLESYLKTEKSLPQEKISEVTKKAKDAGLKGVLQESESADATLLNADAVLSAVEITDVNQFKAGLTTVSGGRPLYPLSKFEDREAGLDLSHHEK